MSRNVKTALIVAGAAFASGFIVEALDLDTHLAGLPGGASATTLALGHAAVVGAVAVLALNTLK